MHAANFEVHMCNSVPPSGLLSCNSADNTKHHLRLHRPPSRCAQCSAFRYEKAFDVWLCGCLLTIFSGHQKQGTATHISPMLACDDASQTQCSYCSLGLAHHYPRCTSLQFPINLIASHTYLHECYEIFLAQHLSHSHLSCLVSDHPCSTSLSIFPAWPQIFLALHLYPSLPCPTSLLIFLAWPDPCLSSLSIFPAWPLTSFLLATIVWRPLPPRVLVAVWWLLATRQRM